MAQKMMSEMWDYIAQQFRDTISRATPEQLTNRIAPNTNSMAEIAWVGLGSAYLWSAVLSGATTMEDAITMDPAALDFLQAARSHYAPGHFPDSMPSDHETLLERADEVIALLSAQLMEFSQVMRAMNYDTWWDAVYTGDEIVARLMWHMAYTDGQMHCLIRHAVV
jgi:uncharacterized damage-inducible protein DinB